LARESGGCALLLLRHRCRQNQQEFPMTRLDDKVAIITGASSGIGRAAALLFARQGAKVVLSARGRERLEAVADEIRAAGGSVAAIAGDVSEEAHHEALVDAARTEFGGLDIAFNNAGTTGPVGALPALSMTEWQKVLDVNLTSGFLAAKYQLPALEARDGGSLV